MKNKLLFFEYVSQYLNVYCLKKTSKSIHTIESYRDNLTTFRKFILEVKNKRIKQFYMEDCSKELILEYVEYLRKINRTNSTINHHISAIKGYLYYVADIKIMLFLIQQIKRLINSEVYLYVKFTKCGLIKSNNQFNSLDN